MSTKSGEDQNAFTQDTASGFANALPDFTRKIVDVAFNLGQAISDFADIQLIDQAYAAESNDPRLSSSARLAIEEARETFQQAAQTVVIQKDMGPNPFHTPGFVPGGVSSATVEEHLGEVFRLSLSFAADTGGQRVSLQLQGPQTNQLSVVTDDGVQPVGANGAVAVIVPEGADQILFTLIASDEVSADATVTLSATLVNVNGDATHTTQMESTISVKAFVGNTDGGYEPWVEDYSHVADPTISLPLGVGGFYHQTLRGGAGPDDLNGWAGYGDDTLYGNGGDDWIFGGYGHDRLYGGTGNDRLLADSYDYHPDPIAHPKDSPPPTLDGKDYADGGEGNDRIGGGNNDRLIGGAGDDEVWGDALTRGTNISNPDGSETFVSLTGVVVPGDDVLEGGGGNDYLSGDGGDDILDGGQGNDLLVGDTQQGVALLTPMTAGDDFLVGGAGNDELQGNAGHDVLLGGVGDDRLYGDDPGVDASQEGDDWLEGGDGADFLAGRGGEDTLVGGHGADVLFADAGDDTLLGGEGDDVGYGGEGADEITAGDGADQFDGGAGDDVMFGDEGDDLLIGGNGLDELDGGAGDDLLIGGADNDTLFGRDGNDELQGDEGNDLLVGDAGDDRIFGQAGDDELFGSDGDDALRGDAGDDLIDGGGGDDILVGDADGQIGGSGGNDTLAGGRGNDTLVGGGGQDTYLYELGDGFDVIVEGGDEGNRLVFGAGINANVIVAAVGPNGSFVLRTGNGDNAVEIRNFGISNLNGPHPIDTFEFSDGSILAYSQLAAGGLAVSGGLGNDQLNGTAQGERIFGGAGNDAIQGQEGTDTLLGEDGADFLEGGSDDDVLFGGTGDDVMRGGDGNDVLNGEAGNDSLEGEAGNDVLVGGAGDDQLLGGDGSDTYRFNRGNGLDSVFDSGSGADTDTVVFGSGITFNSVSLSSQFGQMVIKVGADSDGIQSGSAFDVFGSQTIEQFQFADGIVLSFADLVARGFDIDGTEFDDFLSGTNVVDRFRGGLGNDRFEGGEGNDSYLFNVGDGIDTIMDTALVDAGNEIVFGAGIPSTDLRLDLAPDQSDPNQSDLLIRVGTNDDAIQLDTFDRTNALGPRTVESFRFSDGSALTYEQLLTRGFDLTGTDNDDQITGTNMVDRIVAGSGADVLRSGLGDDALDGGLGTDRLIGGQDNDIYLFGPGAGQDTIVEFQGSLDAIRMAPGVVPSDVVVTRNNNDLVLSLSGGADRLTVSLYFLAPPFQVELVQFSDGTVWDQAFIENPTRPVMTGTEGPDSLVGTSGHDRLVGLAGDDQLIGLAGHDLLDGGTGADELTGGFGDDEYIVDDLGDVVTELTDEGIDTVRSMVTRTLEADVENLTLTGSAANNGTGNALDNVLIGNSGVNVLGGGGGNDTYMVGAGDRVVELTGEGTDTVQTDTSVTLEANVENLTLTGSASLIGVGNELDNVLKAYGSISMLAGGDGNDTYLIGPNGDDDILVETVTGGIDRVIAGHDYRLPANIENLILLDPRMPDFESFSLIPYGSSEQSVTGYGNNSENILIGGRANNVLDGGPGADTLIGGDGNDTYVVDNVGDMVIEEANEGVDNVQSTVSYSLSANVENLSLIGIAFINGTGNELDNVVIGSEDANVLSGLTGDDTLAGRLGNDRLMGGTGHETYLFNLGDGIDTIEDVAAVGEGNRIQFGVGISWNDLTVMHDEVARTLTIQVGTSGTDRLVLNGFDLTGVNGTPVVETLAFSDGSTTSLASFFGPTITEGNDTIATAAGDDVINALGGNDIVDAGAGSDIIAGGAGDDTLMGGPGDDTYIYNSGDGVDTINDTSLPGGTNTLEFGAGIDSADLSLDLGSLLMHIGTSGDALHLSNFDPNNVLGPRTIETFRFADGTVLSYNQLVQRGFDLTGTDGNDSITGTNVVDRITVLAGDDILVGGRGNDSLRGGAGNDTYIFNIRRWERHD